MFIDFYTPWVLFESNLYDGYHQFLVSNLKEKPELPIPELTPEEATVTNILKVSNGFTFPFVIRGMLENSTAIHDWNDPNWWLEKYANETVLCGTLSEVVEDCTISYFFNEMKRGKPFYISGASNIFERNPALHDMIDSEAIQAIEPGHRIATQIFMGVPDMGSDIHSAIGVNM